MTLTVSWSVGSQPVAFPRHFCSDDPVTFPSYGESYRRRKEAWKSMQPSSLAMLLTFAFLLSTTIGLLNTAGAPRHLPPMLYWTQVLS